MIPEVCITSVGNISFFGQPHPSPLLQTASLFFSVGIWESDSLGLSLICRRAGQKIRLVGGAGFRDFLRLPPVKENRDSRWTLPASNLRTAPPVSLLPCNRQPLSGHSSLRICGVGGQHLFPYLEFCGYMQFLHGYSVRRRLH